jgi:hypothetical protein
MMPRARAISKHLLDLLSTPAPTLRKTPPKLLYNDDPQIYAISVFSRIIAVDLIGMLKDQE